jgi:hypothetical protein
MGLLDDFPFAGWRGLLGTPTDRVPWQRPAPLSVPLMDAAYSKPSSHDFWNANPSSPERVAIADSYQPAIAPVPQTAAFAMMNGAGGGQPAGFEGYAQRPKLPPQNLTARAADERRARSPHRRSDR